MKQIKDLSFKILFVIYLVILAADLLTTLRLGELVQYLEANPLFSYGGLPLLILLNIIVAVVYYWLYKKGSINARFFAIFALVAIIMTRLIAIRTNIMVGNNPPSIEQAMAVTQAVKTATIKKLVLVNVLPIFNGLIAWMFFEKDHIIRRKSENEQKTI